MLEHDNRISEEYFEWLYNYVCTGRAHAMVSYKKLFKLLYNIDFTYSIRDDVNRAADGIELRKRYCSYINDETLINIFRGCSCTVLEMIIALAVRCEEAIMDNPKYGDRTKQWFWTMLSNLGLSYMTDDRYDEGYALEKIYIFLNREYEPNGKGGLFFIRNCKEDLRNVEIWAQLCWYLDTID